jgi:hypothetical protein
MKHSKEYIRAAQALDELNDAERWDEIAALAMRCGRLLFDRLADEPMLPIPELDPRVATEWERHLNHPKQKPVVINATVVWTELRGVDCYRMDLTTAHADFENHHVYRASVSLCADYLDQLARDHFEVEMNVIGNALLEAAKRVREK